MSAFVEERETVRYYCSACGHGWQNEKRAHRHVDAGCVFDPETKACTTCRHKLGMFDVKPCAVDALLLDEGQPIEYPQRNCDSWEGKP